MGLGSFIFVHYSVHNYLQRFQHIYAVFGAVFGHFSVKCL